MVKRPREPEPAVEPQGGPRSAPPPAPQSYSPPPPPPPPASPQGRSNGNGGNGWRSPPTATPKASTAGPWPIPGDVQDLDEILMAQAATIHDQFDLLHAYQDTLDAAQAATPPGV
ncbi:MAG TPA: hypothetical protein VHT52_10980, partial [Stellaceae bacterium]|nr:hypothetical protein [Stellaceae bacterium]